MHRHRADLEEREHQREEFEPRRTISAVRTPRPIPTAEPARERVALARQLRVRELASGSTPSLGGTMSATRVAGVSARALAAMAIAATLTTLTVVQRMRARGTRATVGTISSAASSRT